MKVCTSAGIFFFFFMLVLGRLLMASEQLDGCQLQGKGGVLNQLAFVSDRVHSLSLSVILMLPPPKAACQIGLQSPSELPVHFTIHPNLSVVSSHFSHWQLAFAKKYSAFVLQRNVSLPLTSAQLDLEGLHEVIFTSDIRQQFYLFLPWKNDSHKLEPFSDSDVINDTMQVPVSRRFEHCLDFVHKFRGDQHQWCAVKDQATAGLTCFMQRDTAGNRSIVDVKFSQNLTNSFPNQPFVYFSLKCAAISDPDSQETTRIDMELPVSIANSAFTVITNVSLMVLITTLICGFLIVFVVILIVVKIKHRMRPFSLWSLPDFVKKEMVFPIESLILKGKLGSGKFGCVYRGQLVQGQAVWDVAVKTALNKTNCNEEVELLLDEAKTMITVGYHDNLVNLQGVSLDKTNRLRPQFYLILEYCSNGSLLDYLERHHDKLCTDLRHKDSSQTTLSLLTNWSCQIASGLAFVAGSNIAHCDIAARNVLLTDRLTAKVSDFGMSLRLYQTKFKELKDTPMPIRWLAPEGLTDFVYSSKSDVWSFGVLMWEIFSIGQVPYGLVDIDFEDLIEMLGKGRRLNQTEFCPDKIYSLMTKCWREIPEERPDFAGIVKELTTNDEVAREQQMAIKKQREKFVSIIQENPNYDPIIVTST